MSMPHRTLSPPPEGWTDESEQKRLEEFMRKYPWPIGAYPPPKPDPDITPTTFHGNYPKRQPSNTPYTRGWPRNPSGLEILILRFIDWLNALLGAEKPKGKRKETDEQMVSLADLFEEAEVLQRPEAPPPQPTFTVER